MKPAPATPARKLARCALALVALSAPQPAAGLDNGVGRLPAMGYNTWNDLRCDDVSAGAVRSIADAMVSLGLLELGYNYLNVDDCWSHATSTGGELLEDPKAFPTGDRCGAMVASVDAAAGLVHTPRKHADPDRLCLPCASQHA